MDRDMEVRIDGEALFLQVSCISIVFFIYLHTSVKDVPSKVLFLWMENLLQLQKQQPPPTSLIFQNFQVCSSSEP